MTMRPLGDYLMTKRFEARQRERQAVEAERAARYVEQERARRLAALSPEERAVLFPTERRRG
jgi:hypothetical protein